MHYTRAEIVRDSLPLATDRFGASIALDGDSLLVVRADGNPADGVQRQAVLAYRRHADGWRFEAQLVPRDRLPVDLDQAVVAVSGPYAVIGTPRGGESEEGRAFLWQRDEAGTWNQVRVLKSSQPSRFARFGSSVDIDRNTLVVGSPFELGPDASGAGAAHVFQRGERGWRHARTVLPPPAAPALEGFGDAVSLQGSRLLVGAPLTDGVNGSVATGAAAVFERNAGGAGRWSAVEVLSRPRGRDTAQCGRSVALSGTRAVVGCEGASEVLVWRLGSATPRLLRDPANEGFFGTAVDMKGDRLVITSVGLRDDLPSRVYVYDCDDAPRPHCLAYDTLTEPDGRHGYARQVAIDQSRHVAVTYDDEGGEYLAGGAVFVHDAP